MTETVADAYDLDAEDAGHELTAKGDLHEGVMTVSGDQELLTQALAG